MDYQAQLKCEKCEDVFTIPLKIVTQKKMDITKIITS